MHSQLSLDAYGVTYATCKMAACSSKPKPPCNSMMAAC